MASLEYRMTTIYLTLQDVSYVLPDGRALFSGLTQAFDQQPTGLVGRNGAGKTILARILAGQLTPTRGHRLCSGLVHYLAQQIAHPEGHTVADLMAARQPLDALARIERGSTRTEDFDTLADQWDIRQQVQAQLERSGMGHLDADTPASTLSGGEVMRVALSGAMLSNADFLILDEPSNHLDRTARKDLIEQLQLWPRGLVVISHDRQLLEAMHRIVELSPLGLESHGGSYSLYAEAKRHAQQKAKENLDEAKTERLRQQQAMGKYLDRQSRRQARGARQNKAANQAKVLLDRQKERSETSSGALRRKQADQRANLQQRVQAAAAQVADEPRISLHDLRLAQPSQRQVAELNNLTLPYVTGGTQNIDLLLRGQQRVGVIGSNGCGKSTLLRVLAGKIQPSYGQCRVIANPAYLDQNLDTLHPEKSILEQLQLANRSATESNLRMRLAQLGLDTLKIQSPSGLLSGGERLKGALACLLYADCPPQLLLLDEPDNHLDLPSLQALEGLLRDYLGTLVVISHDDSFLGNIALTDYLYGTDSGWCMKPL